MRSRSSLSFCIRTLKASAFRLQLTAFGAQSGENIILPFPRLLNLAGTLLSIILSCEAIELNSGTETILPTTLYNPMNCSCICISIIYFHLVFAPLSIFLSNSTSHIPLWSVPNRGSLVLPNDNVSRRRFRAWHNCPC